MNNTISSSSSGIVLTISNASDYWSGGTTSTGTYLYNTHTHTIPSSSIGVKPTNKRCRDCDHAHLNNECIEFSDWGVVTFVKCNCKEYAPKDNLEYLEYLYDKKNRNIPSL